MATASETLGRFVADTDLNAIPDAVRHEGRRSLLNSLGCALGSARSAPVEAALRVLLPLSGTDRVTVFGRTERLDVLGASFVNAIAANLLDYDDTHLRTVIHPAAPVVPAAFAIAERVGASGQAVLEAIILGMEVACRIGNSVSPAHYARGWHITSTCGVFGAAAAAGKLLGLDANGLAHALGVASSQSAGTVENLPSGGKNVSVGNAARNGVFAALLAQQGYTAAPEALEGRLGWARAMGDAPVVAEMTEGLGAVWEAGKNTYKPYPAGIVMHAVIDACLELRARHRLTPDMIDTVTISGEQLLLDRGDREVRGERDARVSIHHCAAVAFLHGQAGLVMFEDAMARDPMIAAFRARVTARLDPASPRGAATARLRLTDGREVEATVQHPVGSFERPLSDEALEAKFLDSCAHGGFSGAVEDILALVWSIDRLPRLHPLAPGALAPL
jgi:2-methylcitrate dehydratase PrpD